MGGYELGTGIKQMASGETREGIISAADGVTTLSLTIGVVAAVKSGAIVAPAGIAAGAATLGVGALAAGALMWAFTDIRRAYRGKRTMTDEPSAIGRVMVL